MKKYKIPTEFKSEIKIKHIPFKSIAFLCAWAVVTFMFQPLVIESLTFPYTIFSMCFGVVLVIPSSVNPGKKMYLSLLYSIIRDKNTYTPVKAQTSKIVTLKQRNGQL